MFLVQSLMEEAVIDTNKLQQIYDQLGLLENNEPALKAIDHYLAMKYETTDSLIKSKARYLQGCMAHFRKDYTLAISCFEDGISEKNFFAMTGRAYMHENGHGEPDNKPNYDEAIRLLDSAIISGNTLAMANRAYMYMKGRGEPDNKPNIPAAIELYERAIIAGNTLAMANRASMYAYGEGELANEHNYNKAIKLLERAIDGGSHAAMIIRGQMHELGLGGAINDLEANNLYERAVRGGNIKAMNARAYMYLRGRGEPHGLPNYPAAIVLFDRAIVGGNTNAMYNRATMHRDGEGEPSNRPNPAAAIALYDRAIEGGHNYAMASRAQMYYHGQGEPDNRPNYPAASALFDRAIQSGNVDAMHDRAIMHKHGKGEPGNLPNYPAAIHLFDLAIKGGCIIAMHNRANMYQLGIDGHSDHLSAFLLFSRAAELNLEVAKTERIKLITTHPEILTPLLDHYLLQLNNREQIELDPMLKKALDFALSNSSPSNFQTIKIKAIKAHEAPVDNDITSALTLLENLPIESLTKSSLFLFASVIIANFGLRAELLKEPGKTSFNETCLKLAIDYLDVAVINYPGSYELDALHRHTEFQYLTNIKLLANTIESEAEIKERHDRAKSRRITPQIAGLVKFFDSKQKQANNSWIPLSISGLDKTLTLTRELIEKLSSGQSLYSLINCNPEIEKQRELTTLCLELLSPNQEAFKDLTTVYDLTAVHALLIEETPAMAGAGVEMANTHSSVHPEITAFFNRINADRKATADIREAMPAASAGVGTGLDLDEETYSSESTPLFSSSTLPLRGSSETSSSYGLRHRTFGARDKS
ncbi:MAG: tetratricopeptide repeat protein [Gammaproteobacteria bacterium]|nr:tetratricopeptide repeat protein [Gammaproteobacteria bacterium]